MPLLPLDTITHPQQRFIHSCHVALERGRHTQRDREWRSERLKWKGSDCVYGVGVKNV